MKNQILKIVRDYLKSKVKIITYQVIEQLSFKELNEEFVIQIKIFVLNFLMKNL